MLSKPDETILYDRGESVTALTELMLRLNSTITHANI